MCNDKRNEVLEAIKEQGKKSHGGNPHPAGTQEAAAFESGQAERKTTPLCD